MELTDGTNKVGVSAASTAVTATLPALAVGLSPNSPLPAGTNTIGSISSIVNALPAGSNTIGAVTQASGPWTQNLTQVGGSAIALGQATMAASLPVVIASNQSAINVLTTAQGSVAGGTAGTTSMLAGLVFEATPTLTTGQQAALQGDSSGNLKVNLQTALPAGSNTIGSIASINNALPAGTNIIGKVELTDGTNTQGVAPASTAATATQPAAVVALSPNSPLPAGSNALGSVLANLQVSSAPVTVANPVPVTITSASSGTPIQQYLTSAALAAGSSVTLTYTVPATHTFSFERVWASASGKIKIQVQTGASGSPVNMMVGFNSTATPNIDFTVTAPPTLTAAQVVNVIITNEDKAAFDVYATVEGVQIS